LTARESPRHDQRVGYVPDDDRRRILIFDDSPLALDLVAAVLIEQGFEVRTAIDLLGFDRVLREFRPDVILTDVDMPEIQGGTLCKRLKADIATARTPIVLFSAMPKERLAQVARLAGADVALSKLDGFEQLGDRLRELCDEILW
jgi:DNA-binding response OmpR family regulator